MAEHEAKTQSIEELCQQIKSSWPFKQQPNSWYIPIVATLTAINRLDPLEALFKQILTTIPTDDASFSETSLRIQDILFKQSVLIGVIKVVLAVTTLARVEKDLGRPVHQPSIQKTRSIYINRDATRSRDDIISMGRESLKQLYQHNLEGIMDTWGNHRVDMEWLEERVIYGMFLSDYAENGEHRDGKLEKADRPLSPLKQVEVSMVTVASIMPQANGPGPSEWHVRGLMRLGIKLEETEKLCDTVKLVAKWAGVNGTDQWMSARDVADEV